ncbi:MAG: UDP-N-acetylmuramate--alanine ligase [Alphaproteobacteria bacterium]|nr:UDP-N-acetylmuramate--alanine ligase [Alphaproteobacteria bacterium]
MARRYFFCGIGGSGMFPLALILKACGAIVSGSDRAYDQGKTPDKFGWMTSQGITLYPQDGSGVKDADVVIVSTAIEPTIPDVQMALSLSLPIQTRAELLSTLFNDSAVRIAVAGTSGKSTVTGMIGVMLKTLGYDPTVMNGAIFRNEISQNPYATAMTGQGDIFVTESDESDGSISLYRPTVGVLTNISLDHKPMPELIDIFASYIDQCDQAVMNVDNVYVSRLAGARVGQCLTFSLRNPLADIYAHGISVKPDGLSCRVTVRGADIPLQLAVPGLHNLSNALAAMGVGVALGIDAEKICDALSQFQGVKRRLEIIGTSKNITVIDDFAHNPDKIIATLLTLKEFPGRIHIFFQPHGYGFLKLMASEIAQAFADHLDSSDHVYLVEPYYAGGTVDRQVTSAHLKDMMRELGVNTRLCEDRADVIKQIMVEIMPGDRVVVMGARDDTLSLFAQEILGQIS